MKVEDKYSPVWVIKDFKMDNCVSDAVDFMLKHCNDARWDIIGKAMRIMEEGIMKKYEEEVMKMYADLIHPDGSVTKNVEILNYKEKHRPKGIWCATKSMFDDCAFPPMKDIIEVGQISIYENIEDTTKLEINKGPAKCNCDTMLLMRVGCKCGGS